MKNGQQVAAFEQAFGEYVGAKYCVAAANGTVTLQAALIALGVKPGDRVATTPLTMAATSIAILNVGATPVFVDVDPDTWLAAGTYEQEVGTGACICVSLYGLCENYPPMTHAIDDAAQTLRKHSGCAFTSYSFQQSKILPLGEGGMLATNDEDAAEAARSYLSLGYRMNGNARIDPAALKSPTYGRHHRYPAINGRMNDLTAAAGIAALKQADKLRGVRQDAAVLYHAAVSGCPFLTIQMGSGGRGFWTFEGSDDHDYWSFAVATDTPERCLWLLDAVERHGGERPYPAWRLTYQEPAFRHLAPDGTCPIAEALQPRLLQFQTNDLASAERNAKALRLAIADA